MGMIVGLIAGWIVCSSSLATNARRGMLVGLIAGLIFGAYTEYGNINDRNKNNAPKSTYLAPGSI
jgi:hypothetical protein